MSKIGFWIKNARHISLPQSLLPGFLAIGMSLDYGSFSWGLSWSLYVVWRVRIWV